MRVLFVSIALPPKNDPEALQSGKCIKYLSKSLEVDAVTSSSPTLWMPYDKNLEEYVSDVQQTIEVPVYEPKYFSIGLNKLFKRFLKPDSRSSFHRKWKKVVNELKHKPDVIYSRAFPLSSLYMAYKLKKHYNTPWILHLSDPWVISPLNEYNKSNHHKKNELKFFEAADLISFTSTRVIKKYVSRYPHLEKKFIYMPNTFDHEDIADSSPEKNQENSHKLNIIYTGSLTDSRSLKYIIEAINRMKAQSHPLANKILIQACGAVDSDNSQLIKENEEFVKHLGYLSLPKALKLQRTADILLAVDFKFKSAEDAVYFPSKLLDYFIAKKHIIAITTKGSMTDEILSSTNHSVVDHEDIDGLISILENFETKNIDQIYHAPEEYSAIYNVNLLIKRLESIC
jgi:hypothetical protein